MDDFLILPDDKTIENLAREYAKLKKTAPMVSAQAFERPHPPKNPSRAKALLAKCRRLAEKILTMLKLSSVSVQESDLNPAMRKILSKKEDLLKQIETLNVRIADYDENSTETPKRKAVKNRMQAPPRELLLLSADLLLCLDELSDEWNIPEIAAILHGETLCFTLLNAM
ncbi:MAG: hypothetical protein LBT55_06345 [Clostridiaceae bacterium]|jgi:hypothetical protein|nr:hypothetical protein [Clostridiaceae bacterium]